MALTLSYNVLFEVKILHHFFLNRGEEVFDTMTDDQKANVMLNYNVREIFDIYPTTECQKILDAHHCVFKATSQGIIVGVRSDSNGNGSTSNHPFNPFSDDQVFTFVIQLKDMNFLNYTALPFTESNGKMYVFLNQTSGSPKAYPSLTSNAPAFEVGREYLPGDMLSDDPENMTTLYTALKKTTNPTSSTEDWLAETIHDGLPLSYANVNDRHRIIRGMLLYKVSVPGLAPSITVRTESGIVISPEINILAGDQRTIQVDMRGFPDGFYTVHFESVSPPYNDNLSFYLLHERSNPFGIIRLSLKSDDPDFNIINDEGEMHSPVFEIRFRNRRTYWRYVGKEFNAGSVTSSSLPLTRYGVITNVTVKDKDGEDVEDLPNPGRVPVKTEALSKPEEDKFYSEIHIN